MLCHWYSKVQKFTMTSLFLFLRSFFKYSLNVHCMVNLKVMILSMRSCLSTVNNFELPKSSDLKLWKGLCLLNTLHIFNFSFWKNVSTSRRLKKNVQYHCRILSFIDKAIVQSQTFPKYYWCEQQRIKLYSLM